MKNLLLVILYAFTLIACSKEEENPLIGTWNHAAYQNGVSIYKKGTEFILKPGYKFYSDGTLTERQNGCFVIDCFIPNDYSGTWNSINDTLIQISVDSKLGQKTYKLDIESIDETYLKVIFISIK